MIYETELEELNYTGALLMRGSIWLIKIKI